MCVRGGGTKPNFMHSTLLPHMQFIHSVKNHLSLGTFEELVAETGKTGRGSDDDADKLHAAFPFVPSE